MDTWEVIIRRAGRFWVLFSGLDHDQAEMCAVFHRGFCRREESDDVILPVWEG